MKLRGSSTARPDKGGGVDLGGMVAVRVYKVGKDEDGGLILLNSYSYPSLGVLFAAHDFTIMAIQTALSKTSSLCLVFDVIVNMMSLSDVEFVRLEIYDLEDAVYKSRMIVLKDGVETIVHCSPSDGIAIAVRLNGVMFVASNLLVNIENFKPKETSLNAPTIGFLGAGTKLGFVDEFTQIEDIEDEDFYRA